VSEFREECIGIRRPKANEAWTYKEIWDKQNYRGCSAVGRMAYILQEVVELLDRGQVSQAHATAVLGWRAAHQHSLDGSSWKAAWHLTGLPDPYSPQKWGGSMQQLSAVAAYMKAEATIKSQIAGSSHDGYGQPGGAENGDQETLSDGVSGPVKPPRRNRAGRKAKAKPPP
jgi:hypothetical protein